MTENFDDYYHSLYEAIYSLPSNTRENRRAIYDQARDILMQNARAANPPWSLLQIIDHQRELERAILDIEVSALRGEPIPQEAYSTRYAPGAVRVPAPAPEPGPYIQERLVPAYEPDDVSGPAKSAPIHSYATAVIAAPDHSYGSSARFAQANPNPAVMDRSVARLLTKPVRRQTASRGLPITLALIFVLLLIAGALVFVLMPLRATFPSAQVPPAPDAITRKDSGAPSSTQTGAPRAAVVPDLKELGNEYFVFGEFDKAIAAYSEAIRNFPGDTTARLSRAYSYWQKAEIDLAIADYSQVIVIEPTNAVALGNRAVAYNFKGEYDRAIRDLDEAIRLQPANADWWNSRCWGKALAGYLEAAVADCNESLRLRPDDLNTLDSRGLAYLKLKQFDQAIADYEAALRIDSKLASSLFGRGFARIATGDRAGGESDIDTAKAIAPDIVERYGRYGVR